MSAAQINFLARIATFKDALSTDVLRDDGVASSKHNKKAKIYRNGLSIIAFTILEDFIKDRTGEILQAIGNSSINFGQLNTDLQQVTTILALESILERATNLKRGNEDWLTFIQEESKHIASTVAFPFTISKYSLGWDKSNLVKDDVRKFLGYLNVSGGWNTIQRVTSLANVTLIAPEVFFQNAARRRHKAAHNPNANSLYTDLVDFAKDVKSFAFAYDVLLSKAYNHIINNNSTVITETSVSLRFLIKDNGTWKEFSSLNNRPVSVDNNYNRILARARRAAIAANSCLIVKYSIGEIHNWFTG